MLKVVYNQRIQQLFESLDPLGGTAEEEEDGEKDAILWPINFRIFIEKRNK